MKSDTIKITVEYLGSDRVPKSQSYLVTKIVGRPFVYVANIDEHGRETDENVIARIGDRISERQADLLSACGNVELTTLPRK